MRTEDLIKYEQLRKELKGETPYQEAEGLRYSIEEMGLVENTMMHINWRRINERTRKT